MATRTVINDHLAKRADGKLDEDIKENYAADVVLLSTYGEFQGQDGVRESARRLAEDLGSDEFKYDQTVFAGDFAYLEWSVVNKNGKLICKGADSFMVRESKIIMQTVFYTKV